MAYEFKAVRRVEFNETDMAGIVHYANFFRYMETAEHGFFRAIGFSIWTDQVKPRVGWPRVHASCDYAQPLRFEDEVEIHLLVAKIKSKAITYAFRFRKLTGKEAVEVARGALTVVCVTHKNGKMKATKIPKVIASKLQAAPKHLLD